MDHPHTGWMNLHVYCLNILMQNKDMYISCVSVCSKIRCRLDGKRINWFIKCKKENFLIVWEILENPKNQFWNKRVH